MNETASPLKDWFDQQDMTITDLSRHLGLSLSYTSRLLDGERRVTEGIKWRFQRAFGHELAAAVFGAGRDGSHA